MALDQNAAMPPSFGDAVKPNYLGNPAAVELILRRFIGEMLDWIQARADGSMTAAVMVARAHASSVDFARIFSGEDPGYLPIVGWNSRVGGLDSFLRVDMGHYWQSQRKACGDDPFRVLYAWLLWSVSEALKLNDDDLTAMQMGNNIQKVTRMLTGSDRRK